MSFGIMLCCFAEQLTANQVHFGPVDGGWGKDEPKVVKMVCCSCKFAENLVIFGTFFFCQVLNCH